ncbi:MAG: hypothetical protein KGI71_03015, partial [Patescibacteria group bacterium]|nr:hypothetical protein [Patescibacteria group bacterium]
MAIAPPKKSPKDKKGKKPAPSLGGRHGLRMFLGGPSFFGNLVSTIFIFLLLMSAYSLVSSLVQPSNEIPLSAVASDVAAGKVSAITVNGDTLNLTYGDGTQKSSRKDPAAGLPETLSTYGVTPEELAKVAITIQGQSGFQFWFLTLAPIILPLLFIAFLF